MSEKTQTPSYYPVFLDIAGKRCVVIGGGQVALRKVQTLLEYGAKVEVISPELCLELADIPEISVQRKQYQSGDLKGAFLAIVATDNHEINHQIAREARSQAVLVNVVDDAEYCDFILPSLVRRGDMTIAVSTAGRSPALARKLRTRLEQDFGEEYAGLVRLIDEVRRDLKQRGITVDGETWQEALELDLLVGLVKSGQIEKAREILYQYLLKINNEVRQV
ncbi:MAG: bifunctional precorrin-2 dehydrogenase/sirohydrochlorin ferrochelatase [Dehalococcoidales bacterium]|nr:bifunctional precorrin-2 dehydrogenase/sirohydrochlorin ferrochelatase [Dehalococcoidales bacterium]